MADVWKIEISNAIVSTPIESTYIGIRNVVDNACVDARVYDYGYLSSTASVVPGVLRCTVKDMVQGVSATILKDIISYQDALHPEIDKTTGVEVTLGQYSELFYKTEVKIMPSLTLSSVFDIGLNCVYDSTEGIWKRVNSWGVMFPNTSGQIMQIKVTNISDKMQIACRMLWSTSNPNMNLFKTRIAGDSWQSMDLQELTFQTTGNIDGVVYAGESQTLEIQPIIPTDVDTTENPVIFDFDIHSLTVG